MYSRTHPCITHLKERTLLTGPTSSKQTYHVVLDTTETHFSFQVGDSIAVLPTNEPELVAKILHLAQASGDEEIIDPRANTPTTLKDFLSHKANLSKVNASLFKFLAPATEQDKTLTVLETLEKHPPVSYEFYKFLMPLLPRFYSIASSPKVYPNEIHLTISYVRYRANGHLHLGVGSHFLCHQVTHETPIPIYLQPSNHFSLPADPNASIILIGPGTGIAPFRAFLQERLATQAPGRNWVFYGERNRASDFYYGDYLTALQEQNRLRLDLAFSRDQPQKIYVQHRMYENKKSLWNWIENGAYIYICGDAEKMAKDVNATLLQIIREEGHLSEEDAFHYLKKLKFEKRYLLDVY